MLLGVPSAYQQPGTDKARSYHAVMVHALAKEHVGHGAGEDWVGHFKDLAFASVT